MAVSYVTLNSTSARIKWGKFLVHSAEQASRLAMLEGTGTGEGTVIRRSNDKGMDTFYVEAVGVVSGAPVGYDAALVDYTDSMSYASQPGYRASYAQAVSFRKYEQSRTDRKFNPEVIKGLGYHWARIKDAVLVNYASAHNVDISTDRTTATLATMYNSSVAANITALALILNLASIGTSSAASSKHVNVFFAGTGAGGGPITNPAANTYDDVVADPEAHRLTPDTFFFLKDYLLARGVPPINLEFENGQAAMYIAYLPQAAITELRRNPQYLQMLQSGDVSSEEMWNGKMRMEMINGIIIRPFDNFYPYSVSGVTNGSLLRQKLCTNSEGGTFYAVESLVFGAQSLAVSTYDDFEVTQANEDDFGRVVKLGYDIVYGATDIRRIDTNTSTPVTYKNTCSLVHAVRAWA